MIVSFERVIDLRASVEALAGEFAGEYNLAGVRDACEARIIAAFPEGWTLCAGMLSVPDAEDIDDIRMIMSDVIDVAITDQVCEQVLLANLL